jgi:nucleoside 2-deoxyribosyltransferase
MTSYYLAARWTRRSELRRYRKQLTSLGHTCTSQWLDGSNIENAATAHRDLCDVQSADGLILFCEKPRCATRGGRFIETGYALGLNKFVIAVGAEIENIFLHLPEIMRFNTWTECLAALQTVSLRHVWAPARRSALNTRNRQRGAR